MSARDFPLLLRTYWYHPESDCVFEHVGPVPYDLALHCDEITWEVFCTMRDMLEKGPSLNRQD